MNGAQILDPLAVAARDQLALRALVAAGAVLLPLLVLLAGGAPAPFLTVLVLLLGLAAALVPDSVLPLLWTLAAVGQWAVEIPLQRSLDGFVLLLAADLVLVHVCCTLCGYGPPSLSVPTALRRAWAGRAAVLLAAAALTWLSLLAIGLLALGPDALLTGAALGLVVLWAGYLLHRLVGRDGLADDRPGGDRR
jgi:hypothetical protein